jgi:hypothetical protein
MERHRRTIVTMVGLRLPMHRHSLLIRGVHLMLHGSSWPPSLLEVALKVYGLESCFHAL